MFLIETFRHSKKSATEQKLDDYIMLVVPFSHQPCGCAKMTEDTVKSGEVQKKSSLFKPQRYRTTKMALASFTNHINTVHSGLKRNDVKTLKKTF